MRRDYPYGVNADTAWTPSWIPPLLDQPVEAGETLFVSDLHLGVGSDDPSRLEAFVELLGTLPGRIDTLVLGGDVFEFWWEWREAVPRRHMHFLMALRRAADAGVRIRVVAGNHDFAYGGFLPELVGASIHPDGICLDVDGSRWLLVHGDGIALSDRIDRLVRRLLRSRAAQAAWALVPPDIAFRIAGGVGRTSRAVQPGPPPNIAEFGDAAEIWIRRWNLAGVVHGHTHRPLLEPRGGGYHVNNGDWLKARFAVWISPGRRIRLVDCGKEGHPWLSNT